MSKRLIEAMNFACEIHANHRYGDFPYVRHLAHVALVCAQFSFTDEDRLMAAWLHDSIEDAGVSREDICERFGSRTASLVWAVTDGKGNNRAERHEASFKKMLALPDAIIIKLADRIANVESSLVTESSLLKMYAREHPGFRERLYAASHNSEDCKTRMAVSMMWSYLDHLMQPKDVKK